MAAGLKLLAQTEHFKCNAVSLGFGFDECLGKWSAAHDDLPTGQDPVMNIQDN